MPLTDEQYIEIFERDYLDKAKDSIMRWRRGELTAEECADFLELFDTGFRGSF